jgi:two-component system, LytTR family, response regulator
MTEVRALRTAIVDDEAPARRRLRTLLAREPDVDLVAECADGPAAVAAIRAHRPDLLFLDIQMPEMSGFDVLAEVGTDAVPAIVFVTAYDQHALRAFDAHALDYLLKPFTNARFQDTLARARRVVARDVDRALHGRTVAGEDDRTLHGRIAALVSDALGAAQDRIPIRAADRITFVRPADIDRIEGAGNYVRIHAGGETHVVRDSLKAMADRLDARTFLRVHHSHIVNADRIRELRPWGHGEYIIVLADGTRITSSRSYAETLRRLAGG